MDDIIFRRTAQGVTSPQTGLILPEEIMVFDTETTGLSKERDDILQFSAIDGAGNTLMNQLFHPVRQQSWPDAERVNQITPQDVADAPLLEAMADDILQLFRSARLIVAYNVRFDYNMLLGNLPRQRRELCHIFKYSHAHHIFGRQGFPVFHRTDAFRYSGSDGGNQRRRQRRSSGSQNPCGFR